MAEMVKWGVMGNARIARICVIPAIQKSANGRVHALATHSPQQAGKVAAENRIKHIYPDYDELLADAEIDAIYIPLPNHLHCRWAIKALDAGKHVLCEKPLACSAAEAIEMVSAAKAAGRFLMKHLCTASIHAASELNRWLPKATSVRRAWSGLLFVTA